MVVKPESFAVLTSWLANVVVSLPTDGIVDSAVADAVEVGSKLPAVVDSSPGWLVETGSLASDIVLTTPPPDVVVKLSALEAVEVGSEFTSEVDSSPSWLVEIRSLAFDIVLVAMLPPPPPPPAEVVVRGGEVLVLEICPVVNVVPSPDIGVDVSSTTAIPDSMEND